MNSEMSKDTAKRKFYDIPEVELNSHDKFSENSKPDLVNYISKNTIGKNTAFNSPFGRRRVIYCDNIATGRSVKFIENYIYDEVLANYGSTHTTSTVTALQTTLFRHEARDIIRNATRASEHDRVMFVGSGATGAVNKLINGLQLPCPPVVFVCPFTHHSSLLPWREIGAEVVRIVESADGNIDLGSLERMLNKYKDCEGPKIGCFAAASNVTGVLVDDIKITKLLHKYGFLAFWDYATAAPYVDIQMNPICIEDPERDAHKDAIFFSLHKFIGGVQAPGVLIAKSKLFKNSSPEECGGGTVFFVSRNSHRYLQDIEEREEGGTPAIVESIRGGLVMQLKMALTPQYIMERNSHLSRKLAKFCKEVPELISLGNASSENKLPILSFLVRYKESGLFLHHNYVSAVLNDVFGIQARGGCACAGPYAQDLLGIDEILANKYENILKEEPNLDRTHLRRREEHGQLEVLRPGFVRLNLPFTSDDEEIDFILEAVRLTCQFGWKLLPQYRFNPETGEWKHKTNLVFKDRLWLQHISYSSGIFNYRKPDESQESPSLEEVLRRANIIFESAKKDSEKFTTPDDTLIFQGDAASLRWFAIPSEASKDLEGCLQKPNQQSPFIPCSYPLDNAIKREVNIWTKHTVNNLYSFKNYVTDKRSDSKVNYNSSKFDKNNPHGGKIMNDIFNGEICVSDLGKNLNSGDASHDLPNSKLGVSNSSSSGESHKGSLNIANKYNSDKASSQGPPFQSARIESLEDNVDEVIPDTSQNGIDNLKLKENKVNSLIQDKTNSLLFENSLNNKDINISEHNKEKLSITDNPLNETKRSNENLLLPRLNNDTNIICEDNICFTKRDDTIEPEKIKKVKWHVPPKSIFNSTVQAINEFSMIKNNDKVLVCLSGGKDSLSLLHTLRQFKFYARSQNIHFELGAVTVDPVSATYDPRPLIPYLKSLGVPYFFETQPILQQALELKDLNSICSFCSRMKRGRIYAAARREGYNVLAFGQHLDDLAESFMMSVMHNGRLRTMKSSYSVQEEDLRVIRPFAFVREKELRDFAESRKLPIIPENCPACFEAPKERHRVKQILAQQEVLFPQLFCSLRTALLPLMAINATGLENSLFGKNAHLQSGEKDYLSE